MAKVEVTKEVKEYSYKDLSPTNYNEIVMLWVKEKKVAEAYKKECFVEDKKTKKKTVDKKKASNWINGNIKGITIKDIPSTSKKGGKSLEETFDDWINSL